MSVTKEYRSIHQSFYHCFQTYMYKTYVSQPIDNNLKFSHKQSHFISLLHKLRQVRDDF